MGLLLRSAGWRQPTAGRARWHCRTAEIASQCHREPVVREPLTAPSSHHVWRRRLRARARLRPVSVGRLTWSGRGQKAMVEPIRADRGSASSGDPPAELTVGRDEHHWHGLSGGGQLDKQVVPAASRVYHLHTVSISFWDTGACRALHYDHHRRFDPPGDGTGAQPLDQAPGRSGPVPPPSVGPAADHVGGVNEQHRARLLPSDAP